VFERPATAFVARFIGGHNVISFPEGPIAVRTDRMRLGEDAGRGARQARVVAVEYQGTSVLVGLDADGIEGPADGSSALTAVLTDRAFAARPLALGDTVPVGWDEAAAHRLDA
jgi:putative spermidine/putrescine transport system ATP-binding protein